MTALPVPPEPRPAYPRRPLTVADYLALPEDPGNRTELQEGMVVMAARPIPRHQKALIRLITQLEPQLPGGLALLPEVDIDLQLLPSDQPGTVRVPAPTYSWAGSAGPRAHPDACDRAGEFGYVDDPRCGACSARPTRSRPGSTWTGC